MKVKVKSLSRVQLFATPWTAAYQAPLSMGFSRQEYWSGVPLPSPSYTHQQTMPAVPTTPVPSTLTTSNPPSPLTRVIITLLMGLSASSLCFPQYILNRAARGS